MVSAWMAEIRSSGDGCVGGGLPMGEKVVSANGKFNGHAEREKLALEVQAEALRPTPTLNGRSLQERLSEAWRRIRQLEDMVDALKNEKNANRTQLREVANQRRELGINEQRTRVTA